MIALNLGVVADVVGGDLLDAGAAAAVVDAVTIDSRTAVPRSLFVALPGEHVDGHDYVADAMDRGAAGALVERDTDLPGAILVDDAADALLGLGAWVRDEVDPTVVAVTGSSGKTTTKDLIRAAVAAQRRVVANPGSYNNELGVPLTCCSLLADTEVLVAEVGARGIGHVAAMAAVLRPDVAVVTNVGAAHLEMFADLAGVARAKGELVESLDAGGVAVLNADDPLVAGMAPRSGGRVVTYGEGSDADLRATDVELDAAARATFAVRGVEVHLPLPGRHNVSNALAALAVADAVGIDLATAAAALNAAAVSPWRMQLSTTDAGVAILNDAYNANPTSMTAALKTLAGMHAEGRRWAVLGHMAELGDSGAQAHQDMGRLCADLRLDALVVVGDAAAGIADGAEAAGFSGTLERVADRDAAVDLLDATVRPGDVVLVKASRSAGLERVALALMEGRAA